MSKDYEIPRSSLQSSLLAVYGIQATRHNVTEAAIFTTDLDLYLSSKASHLALDSEKIVKLLKQTLQRVRVLRYVLE